MLSDVGYYYFGESIVTHESHEIKGSQILRVFLLTKFKYIIHITHLNNKITIFMSAI